MAVLAFPIIITILLRSTSEAGSLIGTKTVPVVPFNSSVAPDDDEDGARDARVVAAEAVRYHDLVEEGGDGVEEPHVDGVGDEDEPELEVAG